MQPLESPLVPPERVNLGSADPDPAALGGSLRFALRRWGVAQTLQLLRWAAITGAERLAMELRGLVLRRRTQEVAAWRARSLQRLVATLGSLKGAFAKAGQFASIRHDVLPTSMTAGLASLRDRVPPLPFSQVRAAVEAELRAPLESLFDEFEREPLGAASIAQVHRARLTSGESVAVKVQYPWLEGSLAADLRILRALLRWWTRRASPARLDLDRIFEEFARGLREELNFEQEAGVAREIAENLAEDPQIVVPAIIPSHSTKRILTMTYLPAVRIDDRDGLAAISVAPSAVLEILGRAYAMQMFRDGLFHADPHPGNLFVVDEPAAGDRPRLLFVDFGLSRRLDPELRREMRLAIHALLKRDLDGFIQGMQRTEMIVPGFESTVRRAVSSMFEELSVAGGALSADGSRVLRLKDQAKLLLQDTEGLQLPNDLLLYAKTLSYVFRLGDELAPEVDLMKLTLPYLLEYLAKREP